MNIKSLFCAVLLAANSGVYGQISDIINIEAGVQIHYAYELCKHLHQNPELSTLEFETAARMSEELEKIGFQITRNFGGNNLVGIYRNGDGPVVMIRTDMDALPVEEKTGLEFASTRRSVNISGAEVPVMHACGHDIHMSVWTGTLRTLIALKQHWKGTLLAIAQQAEETSGGAAVAIEEGIFTKFPVPCCALAFHINPGLASGKIGITGGSVFAGVKTAEITIYGKGGHGAYPDKCIDPIVIASRIVLDLQTIVSREISPLEPAVITVGSFHGGTRPNIIPDEVKLELTLRYYDENTLGKIISGLKRITAAAAQMAGMSDEKLPSVVILPHDTPPVLNDEKLTEKLKKHIAETLGAENVISVKPSMAGEDFGKYGYTPEKVPVCMMWLGSTRPELLKELELRGEEPPPLHSPLLFPDYQATIETGIKVMSANVIGIMNNPDGLLRE